MTLASKPKGGPRECIRGTPECAAAVQALTEAAIAAGTHSNARYLICTGGCGELVAEIHWIGPDRKVLCRACAWARWVYPKEHV